MANGLQSDDSAFSGACRIGGDCGRAKLGLFGVQRMLPVSFVRKFGVKLVVMLATSLLAVLVSVLASALISVFVSMFWRIGQCARLGLEKAGMA